MLVTPVNVLSPMIERVIEFKGLNKEHVIEDGEMRDMKNLSSDEYPTLYQRKPRGTEELPGSMAKAHSMLAKSDPLTLERKLAIIGEDSSGNIIFSFGGVIIPGIQVTASTKMVAINKKICFFPEKIYVQPTVSESGGVQYLTYPYGSLEASVPSTGTLSVSIAATEEKQTLTFPSGTDLSVFHVGDVIDISGTLTPTGGSASTVTVSCVIEAINSLTMDVPYNTFDAITSEGASSGSLSISANGMKRECPELDYVIEYNNRLWGVNDTDNTIYACKLGDPTNWKYYQSTSLDSYYAEQGTDGKWTGCAAYSNHLIFFKEDSMTRVYGSTPSAFQTSVMQCHGLEYGSDKSVVIVNDVVLYKSKRGIMAYEGGTPYCISDKLGTSPFKNVNAGTDGIKYYASIQLEDNSHEIIVCDLNRATWHKEDDYEIKQFCRKNEELLYIDGNNQLRKISGNDEEDIEWMAEFGPFDEYIEHKKVYSKIMMRLELPEESSLNVYMKIEDGDWEQIDLIRHEHDTSVFIPIVPRRCHRFSIKLEGKGYCRIESMVRQYREGTER